MIFLMFGEVLLHFSTSGILGLFAIFGFEVNKASTNSRLKKSFRSYVKRKHFREFPILALQGKKLLIYRYIDPCNI